MKNFAFYQRMRPILKEGDFNPANYKPEELKMLFESLPVINSEYCNEVFRLGALEYLKDHKAEYPHAHKLALKDVFTPPSKMFFPSLVERNKTLEAAVAQLETAKESLGCIYEIDENDFSSPITKVKKIYSWPRELYLAIIEVGDYYDKWLCTQKRNEEDTWENVTKYLISNSSSIETAEQLLSDNHDFRATWATELGKEIFTAKTHEQNRFWHELIRLKGKEGINFIQNAHAEPELLEKFILSHPEYSEYSEDFTSDYESGAAEPRVVKWENLTIKLTAENVDEFCADMEKATETNYDAIDWPLDTKGLNKKQFLSLVKKYHMPSATLQRVLDEELPKFNTTEDNLRKILSPVFENIKSDITYKPTKAETGEVSFALNKAQTGKSNNLKVILQPKTSPTALFVGKMTDCCQFFEGQASKSMVIPVFTDTNAGLITLNQGSEVIGESFAWLSRNDDEQVEGLVLEAFTHVNSEKALMPLLKILAKGLRSGGLNLYLGAYYKPTLSRIDEDGAIIEAEELAQPKPLSKNYRPYEHSYKVYQIDPEVNYTADFGAGQNEVIAYEQALFSLPDDVAIMLKESPDLVKLFLLNEELHKILPKLTPEIINVLASSSLFEGRADPSAISAQKIINFVEKGVLSASTRAVAETVTTEATSATTPEADACVEAAGEDDYSGMPPLEYDPVAALGEHKESEVD